MSVPSAQEGYRADVLAWELERTVQGRVECRLAKLPKCGDPDCDCAGMPQTWQLWASKPGGDRWVNVGMAVGARQRAEIENVFGQFDSLALRLLPRMSLLVGVPWSTLTPQHAAFIGASHMQLLEKMPQGLTAEVLYHPIDRLDKLGPELIAGMRSVVQADLAMYLPGPEL